MKQCRWEQALLEDRLWRVVKRLPSKCQYTWTPRISWNALRVVAGWDTRTETCVNGGKILRYLISVLMNALLYYLLSLKMSNLKVVTNQPRDRRLIYTPTSLLIPSQLSAANYSSRSWWNCINFFLLEQVVIPEAFFFYTQSRHNSIKSKTFLLSRKSKPFIWCVDRQTCVRFLNSLLNACWYSKGINHFLMCLW